MANKKILIICISIHHDSTMKIARAISAELKAEIKKPNQVNVEELSEYDVIGLGSGIYNGDHHKSLIKMVGKMKARKKTRVFIFSTNTLGLKLHKTLKSELLNKGCEIIGEFACKGYMNYSFTKYIFGGLNKKRPNQRDIQKAKEFAHEMETII